MATASDTTLAIVVTGASSGIGRAIAKVVARERCTLVLVGRSAGGLDETSAEVRQAGGQAITFELDLLSDGASTMLDTFLSNHGLVCDVLINSAGLGRRGAATALTVDEQIGIIDLNIRALTELSLSFLPGMVKRKRGGIINFSSVAGFAPGPYMALYYASKGFVRSLSEALHEEVRRSGVTVTCVAPGPVETDFYEKAGAKKATIFTYLPKMDPDRVAETAWKGFRAGRRIVVPGTSAKVLRFILGLLPSRVKLPLIGRLQRMGNDPCYCGSGRKFKKCCGAK
jgi:uncharacterized protein